MAAPHRGSAVALAATGSDSVRSAPSGMHTSLHTSQSARAARTTRRAIGERALRLQLDEVQHVAFVAIVDERTDRQHARRGPFDRARLDAGGELPGERRRQARIAGVVPVGVPILLDRETQRDGERLARDDRRLRRDELGFDVRGLDRVAAGTARAHERRMRQRRERQQAAHRSRGEQSVDGQVRKVL